MRVVGALLIVLSAAGCFREPAPARDAIRFDHVVHLAARQACTDCHGAAAGEEVDSGMSSASRPLMPSEASCKGCHTDEADRRCGFCHTEPQRAAAYAPPDRGLLFDHQDHEDPRSANCHQCHAGQTSRFRPQIPPMASCTASSCHAADMRQLACSRCHTDLQRYPLHEIEFVRHDAAFARRHGGVARADPRQCGQCHEPTHCETCHTASPSFPREWIEPMAIDRAFVHRGDFLARHSTEQTLGESQCLRCHGNDFCDNCHRRRGLGGSVAPGAVHPPGWLDPGSSRSHVSAARRDILACAACHESDAETVCMDCHRVSAFSISPHPPGFGGNLDARRHGMCRVCHTEGL